MAKTGRSHDPKIKHRALELLSLGWTHAGVARKLSIPRTTVSSWVEDPEFSAELDRLREKSLKAAVRVYGGYAVRLARREVAIALGKKEATMPQVKALDQALKRAGLAAPELVRISDPKNPPGPLDDTQALDLLKTLPPELMIRALRALGVDFTALPAPEEP